MQRNSQSHQAKQKKIKARQRISNLQKFSPEKKPRLRCCRRGKVSAELTVANAGEREHAQTSE
jgi:hypothetical protein